jgi:hypothetical protein
MQQKLRTSALRASAERMAEIYQEAYAVQSHEQLDELASYFDTVPYLDRPGAFALFVMLLEEREVPHNFGIVSESAEVH